MIVDLVETASKAATSSSTSAPGPTARSRSLPERLRVVALLRKNGEAIYETDAAPSTAIPRRR